MRQGIKILIEVCLKFNFLSGITKEKTFSLTFVSIFFKTVLPKLYFHLFWSVPVQHILVFLWSYYRLTGTQLLRRLDAIKLHKLLSR